MLDGGTPGFGLRLGCSTCHRLEDMAHAHLPSLVVSQPPTPLSESPAPCPPSGLCHGLESPSFGSQGPAPFPASLPSGPPHRSSISPPFTPACDPLRPLPLCLCLAQTQGRLFKYDSNSGSRAGTDGSIQTHSNKARVVRTPAGRGQMLPSPSRHLGSLYPEIPGKPYQHPP